MQSCKKIIAVRQKAPEMGSAASSWERRRLAGVLISSSHRDSPAGRQRSQKERFWPGKTLPAEILPIFKG
jgi:hypothetical protein